MHKIKMRFIQILAKFAVSLFTREWIEMPRPCSILNRQLTSPSLRGSGLKYAEERTRTGRKIRLPLYEGVD